VQSRAQPLILTIALSLAALPSRGGERYWEKLPGLAQRPEAASQVGLDASNGLWMVTGARCHYWDQAKKAWRTVPLDGSYSRTKLHGTPQTGLYASAWGPEQKDGDVYRLVDGKAEHVTTFINDRKIGGSRFRVTQNGRLINLARGRVRLYVEGTWRVWEVPITPDSQLFIDLGDTLALPTPQALWVIDAKGQMTSTRPPNPIPHGTLGGAWGWGRGIIFPGGNRLAAFEVPSGREVDMTASTEAFGEHGRIADVFPSADGSVWALQGDPVQKLWTLYHIARDGIPTPVKGTSGLSWHRSHHRNFPRSVAVDGAGTVWIANAGVGVLRVKGSTAYPFDHRTDGSPERPMGLVVGPEGMVYAVARKGIFVYNDGTSFIGRARPSPVPFCTLGEELWSVEPKPGMEVAACWPMGDVDVLLMAPPSSKGKPHEALVVDTASGKTRFPLRLPPAGSPPLNVCRGRGPNELLAATETAIFAIDTATGKATGETPLRGAVRTVPAPHRKARISWWPPYPVGKDRFVLNYWGRWLCLEETGKVAWRQEIPRRPAGQPAVRGDQMVIQSPDKEGKASLQSIDARTGAIQWQVQATSDGVGAGFTEDGLGLMTVGVEYGKGVRHGELALHAAEGGRRLWGYHRSGTDLSHLPLINPDTNSVYAYFNDGSLVCLGLTDGKLVWETRLPRGPFRLRGGLLPKQSCPLSPGNDILLATDSAGTVTVLKPATGDVLVRFAPIDAISRDGARAGMVVLKGVPHLVGDQLLVPSSSGLRAYRFTPDTYAQPTQSPKLVAIEQPPAVLTSRTATVTVKGSGGTGKLTLMYRRGTEAWRREPLATPNHTITFDMLADGAHQVRLAVVDEKGRSSKRIFCQFRVELPPEVVTRQLLAEHDNRHWERFPLPLDGTVGTEHVAIDANNDLWMVAGRGCYSWDRSRKQWHEVALGENGYDRRFHGNPESGLYLAEFPAIGPDGTLYHLVNGKATRVTTIKGNARSAPPELGVTRNGRIISWAKDRLRVYADGAWQEWEAELATDALLFEQGNTVSLYHGGMLYVVDGKNRMNKILIETGRRHMQTAAARLGPDGLLVRNGGYGEAFHAFRIPSGKPIDIAAINKAWGRIGSPRRLVSSPDGSVLALVHSKSQGHDTPYRISPNGSVGKEAPTAKLPPFPGNTYQYRRRTLAESGTRTWFAHGALGVSCVDNNRHLQFDHRKDGSPHRATELALDADGILYVAGDDRLYAYNQGTPLLHEPLPRPKPLTAWAGETWKMEMPEGSYIRSPMRVGDLALFLTGPAKTAQVKAVALTTGDVRFTLPLGADRQPCLVAGPGRNREEMVFCDGDRLLFLSTSTGKALRTVALGGKVSRLPPPAPILQDQVLLHGGGGATCIDESGRQIWRHTTHERSNFSECGPAIAGSRLFVQTASRARRDSTSIALDLESGEQLWAAASQGQPRGSLVIADGRYVVGVWSVGDKETAEVRLTCRSTQTGRTLWQHSRTPAALSQPAIYDHATGRLFAYFDDGTILCLEGTTGKVAWEVQRPESPMGRATASYQVLRNHHCLSIAPELLLATDRTGELSVLSIHTGESLAHFPLVRSVAAPGKPVERLPPLTGPWLVKDSLVVVNSRGIHAYPFPLAALARAGVATKPKTEEKRGTPPAVKVPAPPEAAPNRQWERFPMPGKRAAPISHVGLDKNHGLWVVAGGDCHYWDKTRKDWVTTPISVAEGVRQRETLTQLQGTPETGLYLTQKSDKSGGEGHVYRLLDGKARRITTFRGNGLRREVNLYVSSDGRLLNWHREKLRIHAHGEWTERDVKLRVGFGSFLEHQGKIYVLSERNAYVIDRENTLTRLTSGKRDYRRVQREQFWGSDNSTVEERERAHFISCLSDGSVPMEAVRRAFKLHFCYPLLPMPDGSALALGAVSGSQNGGLYRVWPDSRARAIADTKGIGWLRPRFQAQPRSMLVEPGGSVWFAHGRAGAFHLLGGRIHTFSPQIDGSPCQASEIVRGPDGVLYVVGDGRLYAYNLGQTVTGGPPPRRLPLSPLGNRIWNARLEEGFEVKAAWPAGKLAALFTGKRGTNTVHRLQVVELASGEERFTLDVPLNGGPIHTAYSGARPDELVVAGWHRIATLDAMTGKTIRSLDHTSIPGTIHSVDPVRNGGSLVRADSLICLDRNNQSIWSRRQASGFRSVPPGTNNGMVIVQPESPRKPGSMVEALDLASGKVIWSQPSGISGCGAVLTGDDDIVEGGNRTTDGAAAACLTLRNGKDGTVRWEYVRPGTRLTHAPVIDQVADRVYAYLNDGTVLCLEGDSGNVIWETMLPRAPTRLIPGRAGRPGPSLLLRPGTLSAIDHAGGLTLLNPADGKALARFAMAEDILCDGRRVGQADLVAAPWLADGMLVVPTREGLRAYRSPTTAYQPQKMPRLAWSTPPPKRSETNGITVAVTATGGKGKLAVRYRCDGGEWQHNPFVSSPHAVELQGLPNGMHHLRIRVLDERGLAANELTHEFEIAVDRGKRIKELIVQLGAEQFKDRKAAKAGLLAIGGIAIPYLEKQRAHPDPEIRHQVRELLKALRPRDE